MRFFFGRREAAFAFEVVTKWKDGERPKGIFERDVLKAGSPIRLNHGVDDEAIEGRKGQP
jgi:hypothetical protein